MPSVVGAEYRGGFRIHLASTTRPKAPSISNRGSTTGEVWSGRKAIEDGHAAVHKTVFRNSIQRERLEELTFVSPNAAVVRFDSRLTGDERRPDEVVRSRKMLVVTKRDGIWRVGWGQKTRLADNARD